DNGHETDLQSNCMRSDRSRDPQVFAILRQSFPPIKLRLAAVRRIAYDAADVGLRRELECCDNATMFLGHFGVGFGAKRSARGVSLGTLFAACQLADLLWPTLVLFGIERFK